MDSFNEKRIKRNDEWMAKVLVPLTEMLGNIEEIDFEKHFKYALIECLNDIWDELSRGDIGFLANIAESLRELKK